ncbi:MAG: DNA cytosine methyltransferase, partial [Candidatus Brocadiae bacterium]|nr:DNA cytosine methyltransferase [Candidatus Brocadiia bacterium]
MTSFRIALSIEKDERAHRTLELRSFFRQFADGQAPQEYYDYLQGETTRESLFASCPREAQAAADCAWLAELGKKGVRAEEVDGTISVAVGGTPWWVLIGGPPCQAYSIIGRSRTRPGKPDALAQDPRHRLYEEYLRILAVHQPPVFVMENVPGLLSAIIKGSSVFEQLLSDLQDPRRALKDQQATPDMDGSDHAYTLHSLVTKRSSGLLPTLEPTDYIIRAEHYGIPQARHRVILLGVRDDLCVRPDTLRQTKDAPSMWD